MTTDAMTMPEMVIMRRRVRRAVMVLTGLAVLLAVAFVMAISLGALPIPVSDVVGTLVDVVTGRSASDPLHATVILTIRLPRVLASAAAGIILALSGVLLQGLFRNPLADPGLLGISSGAASGAMVFILTSGGTALAASAFSLPAAAAIGGLTAVMLVWRLGSIGGTSSVSLMILAGVALNALLGAIIGFCNYVATEAQLKNMSFWLLGSVGAVDTTMAVAMCAIAVLSLICAQPLARGLHVLALGEREAAHAGVPVRRLTTSVILLVAAGVGIVVAYCGPIGFVGLVVPHIVRMLIGSDLRTVIPGSALLGATLLVASDCLARTIVIPRELPIGVVTAAIGAPFFLSLLIRQRRREFV